MIRRSEQWYAIVLLLFLITAFTSCVQSFVPNVEKYEELLVVEGNINEGPGPYTVILSKSSVVKQLPKPYPYSNCKVTLEDDLGNKVMLIEEKTGVYKTDSAAIQGTPGRSYTLKITTPDGEQYESVPELLPKGLKIQSLYAEVQHQWDANLPNGTDGYQFYLDVAPSVTGYYLLWIAERTYKFNVDYGITCYYDNGVHPVLNGDSLRTCYHISNIPAFYLSNTSELTQKGVSRFPLNYENNLTKALLIRYSLKASQFSLTKEAFTYWSTIKKMRDEAGEMYTQQPYQVPNNLRNITNPDKPALGYFMAAGLSEKRIFVNRPNIPFDKVERCPKQDHQRDPIHWFAYDPGAWPVFYTGTAAIPEYVAQECIDCRKTGVLKKPSYWID